MIVSFNNTGMKPPHHKKKVSVLKYKINLHAGLILIVCFLFSGCAVENETMPQSTPETRVFEDSAAQTERNDWSEPKSTVSEGSADEKLEYYQDWSEPKSTVSEGSADEKLEYYQEMYGTDHVFRDLFLPQKVLLIGDENIAVVFLISGYDQVKVIRRTCVERVENISLELFCRIDVFDKTNQNISIMLSPESAEAAAALLQQ